MSSSYYPSPTSASPSQDKIPAHFPSLERQWRAEVTISVKQPRPIRHPTEYAQFLRKINRSRSNSPAVTSAALGSPEDSSSLSIDALDWTSLEETYQLVFGAEPSASEQLVYPFSEAGTCFSEMDPQFAGGNITEERWGSISHEEIQRMSYDDLEAYIEWCTAQLPPEDALSFSNMYGCKIHDPDPKDASKCWPTGTDLSKIADSFLMKFKGLE